MEWVFSLDQINAVAEAFWQVFAGKRVFAFTGEMGTGKTTFIRALCAVKKVKDPVTSPSFSLINEYVFPEGKIFHIDLYRLKDENDAIRAGIEDCLYSGSVCLVEWPGIASGIFPSDTQSVSIQMIDLHTRKIISS